jgi:HAD superfamily hydrolase (TIGR01509 family)
MTTAILFDIDGTLVDSNYLHVEAWSHGFAGAGLTVDDWLIHRHIGMDSDQLLETLVPDATDDQLERAKTLNSAYYTELMPRLRVFAGAREKLAELSTAGYTVVLATSAPDDELEVLRELLGVDEHLAVVTSAGDVDVAKPAPDLLQVALEKAGVQASDAVMVGDSVWDMIAAVRAGVRGIGVLTGGVSSAELRDAGASAVYGSIADIIVD